MNDRRGDLITNAYCFVNVPSVRSMRFKPETRTSYFDKQTQKASFSFTLRNMGNVDELVTLQFNTSDYLTMEGEQDNVFVDEVLIPPKRDTTFQYNVTLNEIEGEAQYLYSIDLAGSTEEDKFRSTFWFNNIDNKFHYEIPYTEKPLIIELSAQNLFSEFAPSYYYKAQGKLLFRNHNSIDYYFRSYNSANLTFYEASRFNLTYENPRWYINIGDRQQLRTRTGLARGIGAGYAINEKFNLSANYAQDIYRDVQHYKSGFFYKHQKFRLRSSYYHGENNYQDYSINWGEIQGDINLGGDHKLSGRVGLNQNNYRNPMNKTLERLGYGFFLNYSGAIKDYRLRIVERLGSPMYFGSEFGKHTTNVFLNKRLKRNLLMSVNFNNYKNNPVNFTNNQQQLFINRSGRTLFSLFYPGIKATFGPGFRSRSSNTFYNYEDRFSTFSPMLRVGVNIGKGHSNSVSAYAEPAYTFVTEHHQSGDIYNNLITAKFTVNIRQKYWGLYFNYFYGPYSINQQYRYFVSEDFDQNIQLFPYFERFIYQDIVKFRAKLTYLYNVNTRTNRINAINELIGYLPYGFQLNFLNTLTYQRTVDPITQDEFTYNNSYFELRAIKEFDWSQPAIKYHDLNVIFYKDFNGNRQKDANEPGIKNILVSIDKITYAQDTAEGLFSNKYSTTNVMGGNLLSDYTGEIEYKNLRQDDYIIEYQNVGKSKGNFSSTEQSKTVRLVKDETIYIPFLEHNKIFGRVVMNRSKLSNLGRIDIANLKVKAVDSEGNVTSTLTDANGNFSMYVPSVDKYTVSINNIFYEHFNLQQNNFQVQLNGYKQFEVNFIFNEKRRQIRFSSGFDPEDFEIRTVRRTNLTGTVKDENTLRPIRTEVKVVNNETGEEVTSVHTDRNTGRYSMSFITGENYSIVIEEEGYWYHSERLYLDQLTTIQDVEKDILLENIMVGSQIDLEYMQFAPGSAEIPGRAYAELDRIVEQLKNNPGIQIQVAGHADALEVIDNPGISERRAQNVTRYLIEQGFSNIEYVGYEDADPVASNDTETGRAQNRRIEIEVTDN